MVFRAGKELRIRAPSSEYYAVARITEELPQDFAISDLPMFVKLVSEFKNIEFTDNKKSIYIRDFLQQNRSFEYVLSEPRLIQHLGVGPVPFPTDKIIANFKLELPDLRYLMKTIRTAGLSDVAVVSNGKKIKILGHDKKNSSSHKYSSDLVGECDKPFSLSFNEKKLEILFPGDYKVAIAKTDKGFYFTRWSCGEDIDYYIASDSE